MPDLLALFWLCLKVSLFTFGGGAAVVPLMQQTLVTGGFMTLQESVDLVAIAQMTPGPFSINAATFAGMKLFGFGGAVVATLGVSLPSILLTLLIARFFFSFHKKPTVQAVLSGIRPVVLALIASAVWVIARQSLVLPAGGLDLPAIAIALAVFFAAWRLKANPALLMLGAAAVGTLFLRP